eukprot:3853269-Amphidinium_carterae.1
MLWGATRDKGFATVRIPYKGEVYSLLQTTTHPSLWMIVKLSDVDPIGVFVDDLLKTGKKGLVNAVITKIRRLWKAGDP